MSHSNVLVRRPSPSKTTHDYNILKPSSASASPAAPFVLEQNLINEEATEMTTSRNILQGNEPSKQHHHHHHYQEEETRAFTNTTATTTTTPSPVPRIAVSYPSHHHHHRNSNNNYNKYHHNSVNSLEFREPEIHSSTFGKEHGYLNNNNSGKNNNSNGKNNKYTTNNSNRLEKHFSELEGLSSRYMTNNRHVEEASHSLNNNNNNNNSNNEGNNKESHKKEYQSAPAQSYKRNQTNSNAREEKRRKTVSHGLPLRDVKCTNIKIDETLENLHRLEAILQPAYQQNQLYVPNTLNYRTESELINNSNCSTLPSNYEGCNGKFLHQNCLCTNNNNNNNNSNNNSSNNSNIICKKNNYNSDNALALYNANERVLFLEEYVTKLEDEVKNTSREHAESCMLLIDLAKERECCNLAIQEQEARQSIMERESEAKFDLYVLFTTITSYEMEKQWTEQLDKAHVEKVILERENKEMIKKIEEQEREHALLHYNRKEEQQQQQHEQQEESKLTEKVVIVRDDAEEKHVTKLKHKIGNNIISGNSYNDNDKENNIKEHDDINKVVGKADDVEVLLSIESFARQLCSLLDISYDQINADNLPLTLQELTKCMTNKLEGMTCCIEKKEQQEKQQEQQSLELECERETTQKGWCEHWEPFQTHSSELYEMYNNYCEIKNCYVNESKELIFHVYQIKLYHLYDDAMEVKEQEQIKLLESMKSLRLQVQQYKNVLCNIDVETHEEQHHNKEITKCTNDKSTSSLLTNCLWSINALPYIPSRMMIRTQPANKSFEATEIDEMRKEAIRLGVREVSNSSSSSSSSSYYYNRNISISDTSNNCINKISDNKEAITMMLNNDKESEASVSKRQNLPEINGVSISETKEKLEEHNVAPKQSEKTENTVGLNADDTKRDKTSDCQEEAKANVSFVKPNQKSEVNVHSSTHVNATISSTNNATTAALIRVPLIKRFMPKASHSTSSSSSCSSSSSLSSSYSSYSFSNNRNKNNSNNNIHYNDNDNDRSHASSMESTKELKEEKINKIIVKDKTCTRAMEATTCEDKNKHKLAEEESEEEEEEEVKSLEQVEHSGAMECKNVACAEKKQNKQSNFDKRSDSEEDAADDASSYCSSDSNTLTSVSTYHVENAIHTSNKKITLESQVISIPRDKEKKEELQQFTHNKQSNLDDSLTLDVSLTMDSDNDSVISESNSNKKHNKQKDQNDVVERNKGTFLLSTSNGTQNVTSDPKNKSNNNNLNRNNNENNINVNNKEHVNVMNKGSVAIKRRSSFDDDDDNEGSSISAKEEKETNTLFYNLSRQSQ